jgi:MoaA/NifB/PqqE/SkfB family radical SAM enzyme
MGVVDVVPPPSEWMLEVTNRCNLACPMCLRDKVDFVQADMDIRLIHRLLDDENLPDALWPYGYGEPMIYPRLIETIRCAKRKNLTVSLSTNGTLLTEKAGRELIDSGLDYLIVAFDGATPETYRKYRRGADFQRVKENVERFLGLKLARRSRLHLTLQMILLSETANEVSAFRRLWTRRGVDCVRIREDLLKARKPATQPNERASHRRCFFLWRGPLFVQAGGGMIPCPYYHGSKPFGDLNAQTVSEAWNSTQMQDLRRAHVTGDLSNYPVCAGCPRYQPHAFLAAASFFIGTNGIRRYLPLAERIQQGFGRRFFE